MPLTHGEAAQQLEEVKQLFVTLKCGHDAT